MKRAIGDAGTHDRPRRRRSRQAFDADIEDINGIIADETKITRYHQLFFALPIIGLVLSIVGGFATSGVGISPLVIVGIIIFLVGAVGMSVGYSAHRARINKLMGTLIPAKLNEMAPRYGAIAGASKRIAVPPRRRRGHSSEAARGAAAATTEEAGRGAAAAKTRIFFGGRGGGATATTRIFLGGGSRRRGDDAADFPWRRGALLAATTRIFVGGGGGGNDASDAPPQASRSTSSRTGSCRTGSRGPRRNVLVARGGRRRRRGRAGERESLPVPERIDSTQGGGGLGNDNFHSRNNTSVT